jgi:site-specific recombinase XerD
MDTLTLRFFTRKFKKENLLQLYLRVSINGTIKDCSIHRTVDLGKWDAQGQKVRGNGEDVKLLNGYMQSVRTMIHNHYNIMVSAGMEITPGRLFDRISGVGSKKVKLLEVFKDHNDRMKALIPSGDFSDGTWRKYKFAYEKTQAFITSRYGNTDYELFKLSNSFLIDFEEYLKVHDKIGHNTVMKYISNLKKIVNLCVANGWLSHNPFANFKLTLKEVPRDQLTEEELQTMENKHFKTERLTQVRDIFLFVCYTGLAYIDVLDLTWNDIQKGLDGKLWVIYDRHKTGNRAPVPLLPKATMILDRYPGIGKVFPVKSNQKTNEFLKEIADLCGIQKNLHFHLGRHTFATTVTLSNGVPIETVSKMLGHKSMRSTQIYARVIDKKIADDMSALEKRLTKDRKI